jgi:hypothetical protein
MRKKLACIVTACLLSTAASAWVSSTTTTDKELKFPPNFTFTLNGRHSYAIGNDSGVVQNVAVCYTITVCANSKNPADRKTARTCDNFTLHPGDAKNDTKNSAITVSYPFLGWCNVDVSTEVFGWQHNVSVGAGKVKIWNS